MNGLIMLENGHIKVMLSSCGASIYRVLLPEADGWRDVAMPLEKPEDVLTGGACAGATLGPNAGRLRGAEIEIEGKTHKLCANDGQNELHGGDTGFSRRIWETREVSKAQAVFSLTAADGEGGYPGDRRVTAAYSLEGSALVIRYNAVSTKPTWMNLSNHTYWNLSGDFTKSALEQLLYIDSDAVLYNDAGHLPVSFESVARSPFDFTSPVRISENIASCPEHPQLLNARGYNNAFLLNKGGAILKDEKSGRTLSITTDQPSIVFYSGGYLDGVRLLCGPASPSCAVALEAQELPDAPHILKNACPNLLPGKALERFIRFEFSKEVLNK